IPISEPSNYALSIMAEPTGIRGGGGGGGGVRAGCVICGITPCGGICSYSCCYVGVGVDFCCNLLRGNNINCCDCVADTFHDDCHDDSYTKLYL
ncbi:unnamed protein product, partial [Rotaria magnacalcarata]